MERPEHRPEGQPERRDRPSACRAGRRTRCRQRIGCRHWRNADDDREKQRQKATRGLQHRGYALPHLRRIASNPTYFTGSNPRHTAVKPTPRHGISTRRLCARSRAVTFCARWQHLAVADRLQTIGGNARVDEMRDHRLRTAFRQGLIGDTTTDRIGMCHDRHAYGRVCVELLDQRRKCQSWPAAPVCPTRWRTPARRPHHRAPDHRR